MTPTQSLHSTLEIVLMRLGSIAHGLGARSISVSIEGGSPRLIICAPDVAGVFAVARVLDLPMPVVRTTGSLIYVASTKSGNSIEVISPMVAVSSTADFDSVRNVFEKLSK